MTGPRTAAAPVCHLSLARGYRGGERQAELLMRGLAETGMPQIAVVRAGEPLAARLVALSSVEVRAVRGLSGAALASGGAGLIHAHDGRSVHAAFLRSLLTGTPYVITRRVDNPLRASVLTRKAYARAARVVALSGAIARVLTDWQPGLEPVIIADAHSNLATDDRAVAALRRGLAGRFVVGHVGALDHSHKGQLDLIEAARQAAATAPDLHVLLVGSGRDRGRFETAAAGAGCVQLTGHVDNVGDYLAVFDLFVFPSLHEGMGSVLLDAMRAGLPVIASRVGGIPDIVRDGVNGVLVPPADPHALCCAILRLHGDPALRSRLGEAAQNTAAEYGADRMVQRYRDLYASVAADA